MLNTNLCTTFSRFPNRIYGISVPKNPGSHTLLFGPSPIAIHDYSDVLWYVI
jgi:hypothetical protein